MPYEHTEQNNTVSLNGKYWAAEETKFIGGKMKEKITSYYRFVRAFGRLSLWQRSYNQYYLNVKEGARLYQTGATGEYTVLNANHYHNILAHIKTLTTAQRPAFQVRATNTDYTSMAQCLVAEGILDYYMRTKGLESRIATAVETALIFGEGYIRVNWDASDGKVYGVSEYGQEIHEGDLTYTNFGPLDVIRDYSKLSARDRDWQILRTFKNRFTLIAKFPDLEEVLRNSPAKNSVQKDLLFTPPTLYDNSDEIIIYELYHKPTAALPKGRLVWINDNGDVIMDGPLPYKEVPIYRIVSEEQAETPFGFTVGFDLLPIQENIDNMLSTIATNQNAFGVQNIIVEQGSGLSSSDVYGSMKFLTIQKGAMEPKALQLCSTPPEIFNFVKEQIQMMETLSGVNSVARGQPEASLKSGAALALVQSMAIQFNMPMQLSYTRLIEHLGSITIEILKDYASVPRVATIAGKAKRSYLKEFTNKDIERVDRVIVDLGNPITQTTAGKVNLAETLLQNKLINNPDQYIMVMTTGNLDPIIESKQAQMMLIRSENEWLQDGKAVQAMFTDNHSEHIIEHMVVAASPEARLDPTLIQNLTNHLQDHMNLINNQGYQQLYKLLGEPGGEHQQQAPQNMPPGDPSGNLPVGQIAGELAQAVAQSGPPLQDQQPGQVNGVNLPSGPTNPLTQEKMVLPPGAGRNTAISGTIRP